jgi:predicted ATPase
MISSLEITNFKAFASASIRLAPYTLLSGLNSSGKSTVLQALALLGQGGMSDDDLGTMGHFPGVALNGDLVALGTGQDVLHEDYTATPDAGPEIIFRLSGDGDLTYICRLGYDKDASYLPVHFIEAEAAYHDRNPGVFTVFAEGFQYLRADRINPAVTYQRTGRPFEWGAFLGARGEYTVDVLRTHADDPVPDGPLRHPAAARQDLLSQASAWLSEICPGVRLAAAAIEHTDLVRLGFQFARPLHPVSGTRRPTNVGFGLTYVLPIITACLTAKPGSMVLLENPEAHVHPQGQSAMARLTCAAAAAGAQLVVETHSDHILNGVRLAVKRGLLPPDGVALHYFRREDDGIKIESPAIGPDGMLSQWPPGFFDEWDRSLDQLLD